MNNRLFYLPNTTPPVTRTVVYGYLYNQHAALDARSIANTGWHVPTSAEFTTLDSYISNNGCGLQSTGTTYWLGGIGTNIYNFNARGAGIRYGGYTDPGNFGVIKNYIFLMTTTPYGGSDMTVWDIYGGLGPSCDFYSDYWTPEAGVSIRLLKDSTTLNHGETSTYTGNDGQVYNTICIGTQEWLSESLIETKYQNGDTIPEVTNGTTWIGLSTGALCSYNNIESNAFTTS